MAAPTIQPGKLLLAEPFMRDSHFKRTVVLLTDHGEGGSVGFILNKQIDSSIDDLVADFPEFNSTVFYGGPVQTDTIHYIHNVGDLLDDSTRIADGVYWGGNFEKLKFLITAELIKPKNIRFFVGYSGWSEGQLQDELDANSWIVTPNATKELVFDQDVEALWKRVLKGLGGRYNVYSNYPTDPRLN